MSDHWIQPQLERGGFLISSDVALESAFGDALEHPVGFYPSLNDSVIAGDTVAIVLQNELPRARVSLDNLLGHLLKTNVEAIDITVVVTPESARIMGLETSVESVSKDDAPDNNEFRYPIDSQFQSIRIVTHDADDGQLVSYIVADGEGLPIKVNRAIVDADVILPIGCPLGIEPDGLSDCIFPTFCDAETQQRFQKRKNSVRERRAEIDLANEHLGAFYSIQVVGGPGGQTVKVISGERSAAIDLAQEEYEEAWRIQSIEAAEMAIATIETDSRQQSWKDFARAVVAANSAATSGGPIFVWSELNERPKNDIRKALADTYESKSRSKLSGLMRQLAGVVSERQVFLKSGLSQFVIEELGLGFVDEVKDLSRMIDGQSSGIVLRDAHRCQVMTNLENQDA